MLTWNGKRIKTLIDSFSKSFYSGEVSVGNSRGITWNTSQFSDVSDTELWMGFILSPNPARSRYLFLKADLARKPNLRSESRYAQLLGIKKRSVRV